MYLFFYKKLSVLWPVNKPNNSQTIGHSVSITLSATTTTSSYPSWENRKAKLLHSVPKQFTPNSISIGTVVGKGGQPGD
jgi:hypothetical protein